MERSSLVYGIKYRTIQAFKNAIITEIRNLPISTWAIGTLQRLIRWTYRAIFVKNFHVKNIPQICDILINFSWKSRLLTLILTALNLTLLNKLSHLDTDNMLHVWVIVSSICGTNIRSNWRCTKIKLEKKSLLCYFWPTRYINKK
jgi:hypothetical protein